jgi:hypothetical protein
MIVEVVCTQHQVGLSVKWGSVKVKVEVFLNLLMPPCQSCPWANDLL